MKEEQVKIYGTTHLMKAEEIIEIIKKEQSLILFIFFILLFQIIWELLD